MLWMWNQNPQMCRIQFRTFRTLIQENIHLFFGGKIWDFTYVPKSLRCRVAFRAFHGLHNISKLPLDQVHQDVVTFSGGGAPQSIGSQLMEATAGRWGEITGNLRGGSNQPSWKKWERSSIWIISPSGCFLKWWYPQIIHFNMVFHYKPSILGYTDDFHFVIDPKHFRAHFSRAHFVGSVVVTFADPTVDGNWRLSLEPININLS